MSSSLVANKRAQGVDRPAQASQLEAKEESASASASAGLNLNVFGALSGVFASKSDKKTEADGSSTEQREEQAHIKGAGMASANALASAKAETKSREMRQAIKDDSS